MGRLRGRDDEPTHGSLHGRSDLAMSKSSLSGLGLPSKAACPLSNAAASASLPGRSASWTETSSRYSPA
jgi:hypothetical protein